MEHTIMYPYSGIVVSWQVSNLVDQIEWELASTGVLEKWAITGVS